MRLVRPGRLSIRRRVIVALAFLLALGLVVTDTVTYLSLSNFLSESLDAQLASARAPIERYIGSLRPGQCPSVDHLAELADPAVYFLTFRLVARSRQGPVRSGVCPRVPGMVTDDPSFPSGSAAAPDPKPVLPAKIHFSHPVRGKVYDPRIADANLSTFEVSSGTNRGFRYRAQAVPLPDGGALVVAAPLAPLETTLGDVVTIEVLVSLVALVVLVGIAVWLVRVGLRPLEGMARQADVIAAGDLSRRVEPADPVSETGRLGAALNAMLEEIERAFGEREASESRLRRFVADVSHELRTPLTSIRGYAELFRRGARARPDDLERAMTRIESEASRMSVLVDDLMLLARLDQGRELDREEVDLVTVAADAVADVSVTDPDRDVSIDAPVPVSVTGDEHRLRQLVSNLVVNALLHTPPGTPVRVTVGRSGGTATVAVWDGGPGIPGDLLPQIFDRFRTGAAGGNGRANSKGSDGSSEWNGGSGGTGLGLSIVRAIAHAHGGTVRVTSEPGSGTTFLVEIPTGDGGTDQVARRPGEGAHHPGDGAAEATPAVRAARERRGAPGA